MVEHIVAFSKGLSQSLLISNEFVRDIQDLPNNAVLFTYENENLGSFGPDAIIAADNSRQLLTCLAYDIPSVPVMTARKEYGNNIRSYSLWIGVCGEKCVRYEYLYLNKEFYKYPPTLSVEGQVDKQEQYWFVFRIGNDDSIIEGVRTWNEWVKSSEYKDAFSSEYLGDGITKIVGPSRVYDPIVALYMVFIDPKPKRRILRAVVSGGTCEEALAEIDRVLGKR